MDLSSVLRHLGFAVASVFLGLIAFAVFRWVRRQSRIAALIIGCGAAARVLAGLTLFFISAFELPVARSLQAGGGFWNFAVDSTRYFAEATFALDNGLWTTNYDAFLSPMYVRVLALFMYFVGVNPVAGVFLNALIFGGVSALMVRAFRPSGDRAHDLPLFAGLVAYAAWPAMFIHSTQPLKDDLFYGLIAIVCLGMLVVLRMLVHGERAAGGRRYFAAATLVVMAALSALTDIRWYFPIIVIGAFGVVLAIHFVRGRATPLLPYAGGGAALVLLFWLAAGGLANPASAFIFPAGASPFSSVRTVTDIPSALASIARYARAGFLMSGGDTNIAVSVHAEGLNNGPLRRPETLATVNPGAPRRSARGLADEPPMSSSELAAIRAIPRTPLEHVKAVGLGLTVVFVPISMLQGLGIVNFSGGRGILPIADVDTVFQAVMVLTFLGLIWTRRAQIGNRLPFVMFCLTLAGATAILLGYVVTNYGTLFRMRPMIAMPLALAMVALSTNPRRR